MDEVILIHVGAGRHAKRNVNVLRTLLTVALKSTMKKTTVPLKTNDEADRESSFISPLFKNSFEKLLKVSKMIEENELTNTGYGSSVTRNCQVYCDSSVCALDVDRKKTYQSAVVMNSSKYPIEDALLDMVQGCSEDRKNTLAITPALMRVGKVKPDESLVSESMAKVYEDYRERLQQEEERKSKAESRIDLSQDEDVSDTVGVCVIEPGRCIVAGTSSGGNLFKEPGRIGCAGVVGAGIYTATVADCTACIMCSGNGEDIVQMQLARSVCEYVLAKHEEYSRQQQEQPLLCQLVARYVKHESHKYKLRALDEKYHETLYVGLVGYLEMTEEESSSSRRKLIFYYHTTHTMLFAYKNRHNYDNMLVQRAWTDTKTLAELPYNEHARMIIQMCSIASSSVSILSGLLAFYFLAMIHPKKRVFRYDLILLLIIYDFIKALALLIFPVVSHTSHEQILTSAPFQNVLGWFTCFSIEGADFIILCFAIHIALLIFLPNLKSRFENPQEGGLYPFRVYIYLSSLIIPVIISSAAFAPAQGYISGINWSYLTSLRAVWYFTWIVRYCIVVTVLIIYVSVYIHVMRQYKVVSSKMDLKEFKTPGMMSELLADSIWYKLGKMLLMLVFPDVHISAKLHGRELNTNADVVNLRKLHHKQEENGSSSISEGTAATAATMMNEDIEQGADGGVSGPNSEEHIKELQREVGLDIQRMLHQEAMDRFQLRRIQIMKQMKVIFVYPLAYILLWLFPFIHQCYILQDGGEGWNCYWVFTTAAFFQAFNCTIDTLVFLYRERPWTLTAAKVDPFQRYDYMSWRRAVSFLPGFNLGTTHTTMARCGGSGSSYDGSIDPEKTMEQDQQSDHQEQRTHQQQQQQQQQQSSSLLPLPQNTLSAGIPASSHLFSPPDLIGLNDKMNLEEDISDFVKVDAYGRPYQAQSRNGSSSMDPNDSDLDLRDFLNSALPVNAGPSTSNISKKNPSLAKDKSRTPNRRRSSKFSWKTLSGKTSSGSSRKQSVVSSWSGNNQQQSQQTAA
ncbi:hypothetical protein FOA43_000867 [Brettanomyces nanus]|uniref:Guanylate kinase-like domain-containing protein n=1 Tax=Eeniella nana TaxID=13502 RepID=A0A875RZS8_EENNA|nr:uncharacterized protein FOA43_000867 [Brettanomyces nanus]QPG73555.1 hypothetical protein FOA43_000867 [Brettanomyces nanus]